MASTTSDILIDSARLGRDTILGCPATALTASWKPSAPTRTRFACQVRHEEAAAFMACAYAKYTDKLGVCLGTSGPGSIHLLNGLYDAKLMAPVLALTGMRYHDLIGTRPAGRRTR
jgi:pyruvate dehydrogenase (quinone)/pyruvate oxidase